MTISSNDNGNGNYEVNLRAESGAPPVIGIEPGSIEDDLATGEIHHHDVTVSNGGNAPLRWTSDITVIREPGGRDNNARREVRSVGPVAANNVPQGLNLNINHATPSTDASGRLRP